MEFLILWIVMGLIGAVIGQSKDRIFEGLVAGLLLGPLGLIWIIATKAKFKCPECGGAIEKNVKKCKHCGSVIN